MKRSKETWELILNLHKFVQNMVWTICQNQLELGKTIRPAKGLEKWYEEIEDNKAMKNERVKEGKRG